MHNVVTMEQNKDWDAFLRQRSFTGCSIQQQNALDRLMCCALPSHKNENWKYSNLQWLKPLSFSSPKAVKADWIRQKLDEILSDELKAFPRIVTVNGQICPEYSTLLNDPAYDLRYDNTYGSLANPDQDIMTTLNFAIGQDMMDFSLSEGQDGKTVVMVHLGYAAENDPVSFHPRYRIALSAHARLSIIEINNGEGCYFLNPVYEFHLAAYADCYYTYINRASPASYSCSNSYVRLDNHAGFQQFSMIEGTAFSRQELFVDLKGSWSKTGFDAIQILKDRQHADITSKVVHRVPHCQSDQNVKNILLGHSHGVFQGKVMVECDAQKTDAQQQNQALLLSDHAEIDTKPELEIYTDDVKCSHGAAVGALDQEQLFFLMSRGIPYNMARHMLINAFIMDTVEKIPDPIVRDMFSHYSLF